MKKLIALAALAAAGFGTSIASAADFGGGQPPPREAYVEEPLPAPVIIARPYNNYYQENGNYYASPYPLPYFLVYFRNMGRTTISMSAPTGRPTGMAAR